jgi:hypothetical protein
MSRELKNDENGQRMMKKAKGDGKSKKNITSCHFSRRI